MQEIIIKTENLSELIGALSNALIFFKDKTGAVFFGLEDNYLPPELIKLLDKKIGSDTDKRYEFIKYRYDLLKDLYNQLLEIEKNNTKEDL